MKRVFKPLLIIFGGIVLLLSVVYYWIIYNAEDVLQDLVSSQSNNKLSLQLEKIQFSPYTLGLRIRNAHFKTIDSINSSSDYDVRIKEMALQLSGITPLLFGKNLIIESIICRSPEVQVTKRKDVVDTSRFSLTTELGKIYGSIQNTLHAFQIKYFLLDSGRLTLIDRTIQDAKPVMLSDVRLQINNLKIDKNSNQEDKVLFSDKILFTTNNQRLIAADGNHGIQFSKLRLDTERKWLEIDSCYVFGRKPDSLYGEFGIFFDTLRLIRTDLNAMIDKDLIKVDSALCINPDIKMSFELRDSSRKKSPDTLYQTRASMEVAFKKLLGNLDIDYIGIENAGISITTKKGNKITPYTSERNSFSIREVLIMDDPAIPVRIGSFDLAIRDYLAYSPDSSYYVKFDSIHLLNKRIYLSNFMISPTNKNQETDYKEIKMRLLELRDISWPHLMFQNRIIAESATMIKPEVSILIDKNKKKTLKKSKSVFDVFAGVRKELEIKNLFAVDALVHIRYTDNSYIQLENFNSDILVDVLLGSRGTYEMIRCVKGFSFSHGSLKGSKRALEISDVTYTGSNKVLRINKLHAQSADKLISTEIEGLEIGRPEHREDDAFVANHINWKKAKINVRLRPRSPNNTDTETSQKNETRLYELGPINGQNTTMNISSEKFLSALFLENLQANGITFDGKNTPAISGLKMNGSTLQVQNKTLSLEVGDFAVEDKKVSRFNSIGITIALRKDTISAILPQLTFSPDISKILKKELAVSDIVLQSPQLRLDVSQDSAFSDGQAKEGKLPKVNINSLTIINPVVEKMPGKLSKKLHVGLDPSQWKITGIRSDGEKLTIEKFGGSISDAKFQTDSLLAKIEGDGKVSVSVSNMNYVPATDSSKAKWAANLDLLSAKNVVVNYQKRDSNYANMEIRSFVLQDLGVSSSQNMKMADFVNNNQNFRISDGNLTIDTKKNHFYVSNLNYQNELQNLKVDSLSYRPTLDRDEFMKSKKYQADYIQIQTGKIDIKRYVLGRYLKDSIFSLGKVDVFNTKMHVYKDKRLPFQSGLDKPLPTTIFQRIKAKLKIDSIRIYNASITYEELNEKTLKNGSVIFNNTEALVTGIKNIDYGPTDSLLLMARSNLMDSATIRFRFSESYADTLHSFLMALRVRPFHIPSLNPMLEPLASARVDQGWVDTIKMQVIGREYVAWGKMQMEYRDLRIKLLNKGDDSKLTFKTKVITWIANAFVLKTKNAKTGIVYAERVHDRGIFNYWLKIALSGILTNTGIKTNKKQEKKYYRGIQKFDVPPIPDVEL